MYVSSISPLPKTKPKFPFRFIVVLHETEVVENSLASLDEIMEASRQVPPAWGTGRDWPRAGVPSK